jgi:hypothetical protein
MFLSIGHHNFVFLVYGTCAVCTRQKNSNFLVCWILCGVSQINSQNYSVHRQKHDE